MVSHSYDLKELLTLPFEQNQVWRDLADAVNDVLRNEVKAPREELKEIRDPVDLDRIYKILNSKQIGVNFMSDQLTDSDYDRLYRYVSLYWPEGGTDQFINFIGFIKNIRLELAQLWSDQPNLINDYGILSTNPGTSILEGGNWFPTSHYELQYNAETYTNPDFSELTELFFLFAPIHLVLQRFVGVIFGEANLYISGFVHQHQVFSATANALDRDASTDLTFQTAALYSLVYHMGYAK